MSPRVTMRRVHHADDVLVPQRLQRPTVLNRHVWIWHEAAIRAFEGDRLVFERDFTDTIGRDHI